MRLSKPTRFIENAVLLVDTYNTLKSGVPDAIRAFNEVLRPMGITLAESARLRRMAYR